MKYEFFIKHLCSSARKEFGWCLFAGLMVLYLIFPQRATAQMFSVKNEKRTIDIPQTALYIGIEPATFDLRKSQQVDRFGFKGALLRGRLETGALNFFIAAGGKLTGMDDVSYFDAGVQIGYEPRLLRGKDVMISLPLQIASSITSVTSDITSLAGSGQFNQGALSAGAGLSLAAKLNRKIRLQTSAVPAYGFSFAPNGTTGGSMGKLKGKFRIFFDDLFDGAGLSLGYDYTFRRFDVNAEEFDYDFKSSTILVGITF